MIPDDLGGICTFVSQFEEIEGALQPLTRLHLPRKQRVGMREPPGGSRALQVAVAGTPREASIASERTNLHQAS